MSLIVVGLSKRTVPLRVLESMSVPADRLPKALADLASCERLDEVVVVSTCLRTEVYVTAHRYHPAVSDVRNFLAAWSGSAPEDFSDGLYEYYDEVAVRHLFKVAAGLDSAVLGEGEVLGQIGDAWEAARREGTAGVVLSLLFRHAQEVGKRVRSETGIARGTTSLSQAAVALARESLGDLAGSTVLVVGAGGMGEAMAVAAGAAGGRLLVANRTAARAASIAGRCGGTAVAWADLVDAAASADVILTSTGSQDVVLTAADVAPRMAGRSSRPLLVVDLAVPRDVDPSVGTLPGVTLFDIDDISAFAARAVEGRRREIPEAERIVDEEVRRYGGLAVERQVAPLVAALHERANEIRLAELARYRRRLGGLDDAQQRAVEALTRSVVAKLLHDPTVALKAGSGTPAGEQLAQALRQLFGL